MNVTEIVFSPTGGTEKVVHIIAAQRSESHSKIDLSDAKTDFAKCKIGQRICIKDNPRGFGTAPNLSGGE